MICGILKIMGCYKTISAWDILNRKNNILTSYSDLSNDEKLKDVYNIHFKYNEVQYPDLKLLLNSHLKVIFHWTNKQIFQYKVM